MMGNPIPTVEEATTDNHGVNGLSSAVQMTPVKKPCPRPLSEQLLGRARPQAMHEEESGNIYLPPHCSEEADLYLNRCHVCP